MAKFGVRDTHGLCAYMLNFIRIGLLRYPWGAINPEFYSILNFNFLWWRHLAARYKVEHGCTNTNLPVSKPCTSKRFDGEVVSTNSTVQNRDGHTKNKIQAYRIFSPLPTSARNSESPTILGMVIKGVRMHSCTSNFKTFIAARGRWKLGENAPSTLNPYNSGVLRRIPQILMVNLRMNCPQTMKIS